MCSFHIITSLIQLLHFSPAVPPHISLDPARQVVRPGDLVKIRCSATGPQPITIEWNKDVGRMPPSVIINGGELTVNWFPPVCLLFSCVGKNSTKLNSCNIRQQFGKLKIISKSPRALTIPQFRGIATTDAGRYICVARNNGGTTRAVAEVVVNGKGQKLHSRLSKQLIITSVLL